MPFRKDNNKLTPSNNRFSSLASDKDSEDSFKKRSNRSGKSRKSSEKSSEKIQENSRFKDLETKKNIFSQPAPKENSRWRRNDGDKGPQNRIIHRHENREERNKRSGFGNRRQEKGKPNERSRERWDKERRPTYRKGDDSEYKKRRQRGRVNNFTKKPPAFNVDKENFPSLSGKDTTSTEIQQPKKQVENEEKKQPKTQVENEEESNKKSIKKDFKEIIKNRKKKFARAPKYSVEPGWVKMRFSKGKIIKTEGPKIRRIQRPINIIERQRQIMAEMNERHRFNRDLDGLTLTDILGEDAMLSDDDDMLGYNSGSDNDGINGAYDDDYY